MEVISPVDVSPVARVVVPLGAKAGFVECMVIPCKTASFRGLKKDARADKMILRLGISTPSSHLGILTEACGTALQTLVCKKWTTMPSVWMDFALF